MFGQLEGTGYEIHDAEFSSCILGSAHVERLWTGGRWCEDRHGSARTLPCLVRHTKRPNAAAMTIPTDPSRFFALSIEQQRQHHRPAGRLVTCEHLSRRVTRTGHDGTVSSYCRTILKVGFNSPNDVVEHSDGSIWFIDPDYGILMDYEGRRRRGDRRLSVYRIDPHSGCQQSWLTITLNQTASPSHLMSPFSLSPILDERITLMGRPILGGIRSRRMVVA